MSPLPKAEKLGYSVAEACAALSIGKTSLYTLIAVGQLPKVRIGGRTIIPADGLKALLLASGKAAAAQTKPLPASDVESAHSAGERVSQ